MPRPVEIAATADGTLTYLIDHHPSELPAVRTTDILIAWGLARGAAHRAAMGASRAFRFRSHDGGWTDLALNDRDALCWAGAVDHALDMETMYGLSVCLRLIALVDLLARAPWANRLVDLSAEAGLHPALLRLAAESRLTDDAGFDEDGFQNSLQNHPATNPKPSCGATCR